MRPIDVVLVLLAATCGLSAAPMPARVDECACSATPSIANGCVEGCTITVYDLTVANAACALATCVIIPSNVCSADLTFSFGGSCSGGPVTLNAKAPCDGQGSSSVRCPGGAGFVELSLDCAANCGG